MGLYIDLCWRHPGLSKQLAKSGQSKPGQKQLTFMLQRIPVLTRHVGLATSSDWTS